VRAAACAALAGLAALSSGCASIVSGSTQKLHFTSEPSGAEVVFRENVLGTTPTDIVLKRGKKHAIVLRKEGYADATLDLKTRTNPTIWLNACFLSYGALFSTTDASSGAFYKYDPDSYFVTLEPADGFSAEAEPQTKRGKVVRFVVINYAELTAELSKGEGERLDALLQLLSVPDKHRETALRKFKELFVEAEDGPSYGKAIADAFKLPE
jgi:hypothetical protein